MWEYPSPALPSLAPRSPFRQDPKLWRKRYLVLIRRFRLRVSGQWQCRRHPLLQPSSDCNLAHELSLTPLARWRPRLAMSIHTYVFLLNRDLERRPRCDAQLDRGNSAESTRDQAPDTCPSATDSHAPS